MKEKKLLFLDTEFDGLETRTPLSIALVSECGHQFYAEFEGIECKDSFAKQYVELFLWKGNVPNDYKGTYVYDNAETICKEIGEWFQHHFSPKALDETIEFEIWADYPIFDIEIMTNLMKGHTVWFIGDIESYELFNFVFDIWSVEKFYKMLFKDLPGYENFMADRIKDYGNHHALTDAWKVFKHYEIAKVY